MPVEFFQMSRNRPLEPCGLNVSDRPLRLVDHPSETSPSYEQSRLGVPGSGDGVFCFETR